jgi:hypothetical protein
MAFLAGNLKLKTVLTLATAVVGVGILCGVWLSLQSGVEAPTPGTEGIESGANGGPGDEVRPGVTLNRGLDAQSTGSGATDASTPTPVEQGPSLSTAHRAVLKWQNVSIPASKKKDTTRGLPFKVNIYQDDPGAGVNRAKLDLDRDDAWDEKFTFEPGGGVLRKVSPADDENYSELYRLGDTGWEPATE